MKNEPGLMLALLVSLLLLFVTMYSMVGCSTTNDVIYQKDCRNYPISKRCVEVPIGRGRHFQ